MTFTTVTRDIRADAPAIWDILTDARQLTPGFGIIRIEGTIGPNANIKLWTDAAPKRAFALRVSTFDPNKTMVWSGGMPLGLFRGLRRFTLVPIRGGTQFTMREDFSGPLAGLITRSMPDLQPSFDTFADALKEKAEI